jgi:hypothetical protein
MPVDRLLERVGGGADFGSGGLHSIRHGADGIGNQALPAQ